MSIPQLKTNSAGTRYVFPLEITPLYQFHFEYAWFWCCESIIDDLFTISQLRNYHAQPLSFRAFKSVDWSIFLTQNSKSGNFEKIRDRNEKYLFNKAKGLQNNSGPMLLLLLAFIAISCEQSLNGYRRIP